LPVLAAAAAVAYVTRSASAEFATAVQSFDQGSVAFADGVSTYNNAGAATGQPNRIAGAGGSFPGPVTPFNPPYEASQIVAVGLGGQITLELPSAVPVVSGSLQVGIFHAAGLNDPAFNGQAESPARTFAGREFAADRTAVVELADVLGNFKSLGRVVFTQPTQGFANQADPYVFPAPPVASDFNKPFAGELASFNGMNQAQMTTLLDGSAGGTWLGITPDVAAQLGEIRYVRISDPKWQVIGGGLADSRVSAYDAQFSKPADLFVDGVNVVPEPATLGVIVTALVAASGRRRGRRRA
jgi:hypothetical protein